MYICKRMYSHMDFTHGPSLPLNTGEENSYLIGILYNNNLF